MQCHLIQIENWEKQLWFTQPSCKWIAAWETVSPAFILLAMRNQHCYQWQDQHHFLEGGGSKGGRKKFGGKWKMHVKHTQIWYFCHLHAIVRFGTILTYLSWGGCQMWEEIYLLGKWPSYPLWCHHLLLLLAVTICTGRRITCQNTLVKFSKVLCTRNANIYLFHTVLDKYNRR